MSHRLYTGVMLIFLLALTGCTQSPVRDQVLPRDQIIDGIQPLTDADYPAYKTLVWGFYWPDMPGWAQQQGQDDFTKLILTRDDYRLSITQFSGPAGSLLANINRWRRQLSLPPIAVLPVIQVQDPYRLVQLTNTQDYFTIAITQVHGEDWFIKLSGPYTDQAKLDAIMTDFLAQVQLDPHDH